MNDKITISGVKARGFHGVFPGERREGQDFIVDLELFLDLSAAGKSDDLTKTIDYSKVASFIVEEITGAPLNLIEALGQRIIDRIFKEFPEADKLQVTVHKPSAPVAVDFDDISITLERIR